MTARTKGCKEQTVVVIVVDEQAGAGAGTIAADLGVPVDTARSWLRAETGRPSCCARRPLWAHSMDPLHPPIEPAGSGLADALSALGHALAATRRRLTSPATPWQLIGWITGGRLLAPLRSAHCC